MLITFEGIDGSGKSTQVQLLANWLEQRGKKVAMFREPGGTVITEKIRSILLTKETEELSVKAELLLFLAARNHLITTKIVPLLESGAIVLLDRYSDSTLAYQGYGRGLYLNEIQQLLDFSTDLLRPNVTFYIDMCFTDTVKRLSSNSMKLDRFESLGESFYEKVRNGYLELQLQHPERIKMISGLETIESIHSFVTKQLLDKFSSLL
jgi:dTMP kinase